MADHGPTEENHQYAQHGRYNHDSFSRDSRHDIAEEPNAAAQGRAGMDAEPETWMLSARSLE